MKKAIARICYYGSWVVHGLILDSVGAGVCDWEWWVATVAMAAAMLFDPSRWEG